MKSIWKWKLKLDQSVNILEMPGNAEIITVQIQFDDMPHLWAIVNIQYPLEKRKFVLYRTGQELPSNPGVYIGTFQIYNNGVHVFEDRSYEG